MSQKTSSKMSTSSSYLTNTGYEFQLYTPTIIALVGYVIMALVILLPFEFPVYDERTDETYIFKYNFTHRLITVLLMAIPIALSVYSINCMMSGQCLVWSYVVSIVTVLWITMFVLTALIYTWSPQQKVKDDIKEISKML